RSKQRGATPVGAPLAPLTRERRELSQVKVERPLSPHLSIYRMTLTMLMSIVHRITGAGLYFGMLLVAWWLMAAASGANGYARFQSFMGSWFGCLLLI